MEVPSQRLESAGSALIIAAAAVLTSAALAGPEAAQARTNGLLYS